MKLRWLVLLFSVAAFTVSCAHKKTDTKGADKTKQTKQTTEIKADKHKTTIAEGYTCLVNKDKRLITLGKEESKCKVHYTRKGEKLEVAWGQAHPEICRKVYSNIRENIEKKGFKCTTGLEGEKKDDKKTASAKELTPKKAPKTEAKKETKKEGARKTAASK